MIAALAGLCAGLIIGSFIAALTWRWPAGRSIVAGRSRCDHCDAPLSARDLVPVFSFLVLRGRCRQCGAAIAPRHLAIEVAAGLVGALALALQPGAAGVAGAGLGWALLALAILDVEHFWLPDRLTLPLLLTGLVAGVWLAPPLLDRAIGAGVGFAALAGIAAAYKARTGRDGLGGGDPRLFAAIGAWLGWAALPLVLLAAATLGLVLVGIDRLRGRPVTRHSRVAFGALLAVSAWPIWLVGPL
jgi:leader peptidase (prepilin peptidase)/N-methyltransferase